MILIIFRIDLHEATSSFLPVKNQQVVNIKMVKIFERILDVGICYFN